eukprot:1194848-Rhodomonas_salina.3
MLLAVSRSCLRARYAKPGIFCYRARLSTTADERYSTTTGVSSTFMRALATAGVNVRAIAQGSSERQVRDQMQ